MDPNEASRLFWKLGGISVVPVERQLKKKWLLCAIEAWLNNEAMLGCLAYLMSRVFGGLE
jgi:hypothetical protein